MPLLGDATATTTATMESNHKEMRSLQDQTDNKDTNKAIDSSSSIDHEFDNSQCLFCDQISLDLEQNLEHMSKSHGLHLATTNLTVDIETLLAYFNLVISTDHECLYCGTQRNARQAVQQHMIAKGHCKYDLTAKDSEFREFYDLSSLEAEEELQRNLIATRLLDAESAATHSKFRRSRSLKHANKQYLNFTFSLSERASTSSSHSLRPKNNDDSSSDDASSDDTERSADLLCELSIREQKRSFTLNNQLSQLRADDRRSLMHLPVSQQRTLLATHHKQLEKARSLKQTR
jgi:pre-60S factor REI1